MIFIDMIHQMIHGYVLMIFHLKMQEQKTQFSYNNKGYVLSGDGDDHGPLSSGEFWEYNPLTDNWSQLPSHPGDNVGKSLILLLDVMFIFY